MQKLQPAFLLYPDPYDACPPEVRKRTDLADRHLQRTVFRRSPIRGFRQPWNRLIGDLAQELQREMTLRPVDPRQLGRLGAEARRCVIK